MFMLRPMMLGAGLLSALRPQDVFATSLYTGTGASQTITNGLDLAGKGGLAWTKRRDVSASHRLNDSARGTDKTLFSDTTDAEQANSGLTFGPNGYTAGPSNSTASLVNWSFRRAPKFFDIVTYTGDGTSGRVIPHGLGIKPGFIAVKRRNVTSPWYCYHRSIGAGQSLFLNQTNGAADDLNSWNNTEPTAAGFTVGFNQEVNASGSTYVAYLFAHDPDTTNGIVQCGSGNATLPWNYQWLLFRDAGAPANWLIQDSVRGITGSSRPTLYPNLSDAEVPDVQSKGTASNQIVLTGNNPIWLAIRAPIT